MIDVDGCDVLASVRAVHMPSKAGLPWFRVLFLAFLVVTGRCLVQGDPWYFPRLTTNGDFNFSFPTNTAAYYRIFHGTNVASVNEPGGRPEAIVLGRPGQTWLETGPLGDAGFYRVQEVEVGVPLDSDGDGVDDVWELRRPGTFDPLDAADAASDPEGDGQTLLQDYQQALLDTTAPFIQAMWPGAGRTVAGGVSNSVAVTFSEPIDPGSLVQATFRLYSAGPDQVPNTADDVLLSGGQPSYQADSRAWVLGFGPPLANGRYRAEVAGSIRDTAGNVRAGRTAWIFRVAYADLTKGESLNGRASLLEGVQDEYSFTARAGQTVLVDCRVLHVTYYPTPNGTFTCQVRNDETGKGFSFPVPDSGLSGKGPWVVPADGRYTVTVKRVQGLADYSLRVVQVPPPEEFPLVLGTMVTNGVPGPGAGMIEAVQARDVYTFEAAAGQTLFFQLEAKADTLPALEWELEEEGGVHLPFGNRLQLGHDGRYRLTLNTSPFSLGVGAYAFTLLLAPPPQEFPLAIGGSVTNGVPGPGAGMIGSPAEQEVYTFQAMPGQEVFIRVDGMDDSARGVIWQLLKKTSETVLYQDSLEHGSSERLRLAEGGLYRIAFNRDPRSAGLGKYAFNLLPVPVPQEFSLQIGDSVTDGMPAPGAGVIGTQGARDIYTFEAAPGQDVFFRTDNFSTGVMWRLQDPAEAVLFERSLVDKPPGRWRLSQGGHYTLTVYTPAYQPAGGTYAFTLFPATPQEFPLVLGATVTNGVPGPGAGVIENPGAQDIYTFEAAPGQQAVLEVHDVADSAGELKYLLEEDGGTWVFQGRLSDYRSLPFLLKRGGRYRFSVNTDPRYEGVGTYSFSLRPRVPQEFALQIGDSVTNGVPAPGAGFIEVPGDQDSYTFEAEPGQEVFFDAHGHWYLEWELRDEDGNDLFNFWLGREARGRRWLARGGRYTLKVKPSVNFYQPVAYGFSLLPAAASQEFSVAIGDSITNGVPGAGAGVLETWEAQDLYTFEATPGQEVFFQIGSAVPYYYPNALTWQLRDGEGKLLFDRWFSQTDQSRAKLERSGRYTLAVNAGPRFSGAVSYGLNLRTVPEPQRFSVRLGSSVTNGVPVAGAGLLEAPGAQDIYTFDADPGQEVIFRLQGLPYSIGGIWSFQDPEGQPVAFTRSVNQAVDGWCVLERGGRYALTVTTIPEAAPNAVGYGFDLVAVPPTREFPLLLGDSVTNGVPGPGAGVIETLGARQRYVFDAEPGQWLTLRLDELAKSLASLKWELRDEAGQVTTGEWSSPPYLVRWWGGRGGRYTLTINGVPSAGTGRYAFTLLREP